MGKSGKIVVFIIVAFVITMIAAALKKSGAGAVLSVGAVAIYILYQSMFKKDKKAEVGTESTLKKYDEDNEGKEITLKK